MYDDDDGMQCSGVQWNGSMECNAVECNGMDACVILALLGYLFVVFDQKRKTYEFFDAPQAYQRSVPD